MYRIVTTAALAAVVAGCNRPAVTGLEPVRTAGADSAPAAVASPPVVIIREIQREAPEVRVDTVYVAEEPVPAETVYYEEEYESYVFVPVVMPPPPHCHPWPPGHGLDHEHEREHEGRGRRSEPPRPPHRDTSPMPPVYDPSPALAVPATPAPPRKTVATAPGKSEQSPGREMAPPQPVVPRLRAPAKGDSVKIAPAFRPRPMRKPAAGRNQMADAGK